MPVVAAKDASSASSAAWPMTETIGAIDYDASVRVTATPVVAIPRVTPAPPRPEAPRAPAPLPRAAAPGTVIPVPLLPTMQHTGGASRQEPVVRASPAQVPAAALQRFPKGTGPFDSTTTARTMPAMSEDTVPNLSVGDRTTPGITMPMAARAVELPSVKRRAAAMRR
jgi:hypothetical protein